jgi:peroxiredoxin
LAGLQERFEELSGLGFGVAAVSVDGVATSRALSEQLALSFPLLCDPAREVVRAFGLFNAGEKGGIAYPATFVLDRDRTVRFRSLDRTASRVNVDELFAFLRSGVDSPAPASPRRSGVIPRLRDFLRATRNMLRFGLRSPNG